MKRLLQIAALAALIPISASADIPTLTVTSPTDTVIYVPSFPANIGIGFDVTHYQGLSGVHPVKLDVNDQSIVDVAGNAFTDTACTSESAMKFDACGVSGSTASLLKRISVQAPGTFAVTVQARHKLDIGSDEAIFEVILLQVEYPAPPAEANKYIQKAYGKMPSACRGGIISQIAENHAKASRYGAKGGPYNIPLIQSDVNAIKAALGC